MKETQQTQEDKIEIVNQAEKKTVLAYIGSIRNMKKGQTLFEFDKNTLKITPAVFESTEVSFADAKKGNIQKRKKLVIKENCIYIPALNVNNVIKKLTNPNNFK